MAVLVGKKAPDFVAEAIVNGEEIIDNFSLSQFIGKKYIILFFYPKDFTFVCPTEILAFESRLADFEKRNTQVIGVSTDSINSHHAWLQMDKTQGGIKGVTYPLVADLSKTISKNYDVLAGDYEYEVDEVGNDILKFNGDPVAYRGLFLIDLDGVVRHQLVNDDPLGRNIEEAVRIVDALQFHEKNGMVCPANWEEGKDGMEKSPEGVANYLSTH